MLETKTKNTSSYRNDNRIDQISGTMGVSLVRVIQNDSILVINTHPIEFCLYFFMLDRMRNSSVIWQGDRVFYNNITPWVYVHGRKRLIVFYFYIFRQDYAIVFELLF